MHILSLYAYCTHTVDLTYLSPLPLYSYHQKYLLRQQRAILDRLGLSEDEIKNSHVCARLNGYCGGYGSAQALEKEVDGFGLEDSDKERIKAIVARGRHH